MLLNELGDCHLFGGGNLVIQGLTTVLVFSEVIQNDDTKKIDVRHNRLDKHGLDQRDSHLQIPVCAEVMIDTPQINEVEWRVLKIGLRQKLKESCVNKLSLENKLTYLDGLLTHSLVSNVSHKEN